MHLLLNGLKVHRCWGRLTDLGWIGCGGLTLMKIHLGLELDLLTCRWLAAWRVGLCRNGLTRISLYPGLEPLTAGCGGVTIRVASFSACWWGRRVSVVGQDQKS